MATLKLEYYRGPDAYSDGAVEDELLEIFGQRRDVMAILDQEQRWPMLYHLSPARRALLEWAPWAPQATVLEIGAGCGALTGLLCEKSARVTAVELSAKRSRIIHQRYLEEPRLEVLAGDIMTIPLSDTFEVVTLIGVLEYAGSFIKAARPAQALLRRAASLLTPTGRLWVALENRYGLKYFAGAADDHTRRLFDGIEDYPQGDRVITFSKHELAREFQASGLHICRWYYPYPDYKFPREIFSDRHLPALNHKFEDAPNYDHERLKLFSERHALPALVRNGMFDFFANAFLVEAQQAR